MKNNTALDFVQTIELIDELELRGYTVFTINELFRHDEDVRQQAIDNEILLCNCSDAQFEQEGESRGYYLYEYDRNVERIVQLIREGNPDWQNLAIAYFADIKGIIL